MLLGITKNIQSLLHVSAARLVQELYVIFKFIMQVAFYASNRLKVLLNEAKGNYS